MYSRLPRQSCLVRLSGPYLVFLHFGLLALFGLTASRIALIVWQWDRVQPAGNVPWMLLQGVRADLILIGLLLAIPVLAAPVGALARWQHIWRRCSYIWSLVAIALLTFIELSTPPFLQQYDVRPNRLYIEYLQYPKEVFNTLWQGFRLPLLLGSGLTVLLVWVAARHLRRVAAQQQSFGKKQLWLSWPLVVLMVFVCIRSTTQHRPANPALFAITSDAMVNSLIISSGYSVLYALYSLRYEARSTEIYGKLDNDTMLQRAKEWPWLNTYQFDHPTLPTWHHQRATVQRKQPLNLVIVLQESMGATFVESLGGVPVTPELEKLKAQGQWFEQLYATGTRSVRGIEAVVAGFSPTPAQSTVKLSLSQQNFTTLASILKGAGFHTQFIYGGEAHFDNMRGFFTGNGFSQIVDINQIENPTFVGSWGASDEDVFDKADAELTRLQEQRRKTGQPFFSLVFTSSNHEPFEFPDNRIDLHEAPKNTVNNAVKYADWAMGQFFAKARGSAYWRETLFLIVADHDNRVYGANLIPVEKFHIPGLILGADTQPGTIPALASQVDLAPTLLSMLGVSSCHPMIGRDFTLDANSPGRALIQFEQYFALMQPDGLTILKPDGAVQRGSYDQKRHVLKLDGRPASRVEHEKALAEVQLPSYLYRERKYRSEHRCDVVFRAS